MKRLRPVMASAAGVPVAERMTAGPLPAAVALSATATQRRLRPRSIYVGAAMLAVIVRILPLLRGAGLRSYGRYDDGVYYAASDALIHGRVPYRDFVLLHPPGLMLVLTPFALLGTLTSDPIGMATARVAFIAIGALNTGLVAAIALRWGHRPAVIAGVLYACWLPAVYSEQSTLLEPLGGMAVLVALLLLLRNEAPPSRRAELVAGLALGFACVVKIWYVAPLAAVLCCVLLLRRPAGALRILGGAALASVIVTLPFFVLAPTKMWDMVLRDQLVRSDRTAGRLDRLTSILGVRPFAGDHIGVARLLAGLVLLLLALATVACLRDRRARVIAAVLVADLAVLLSSPPYFAHYAALTAAPASLVLAIGASRLVSRPSMRSLARPLTALAVIISLASAARIVTVPQGQSFPGKQFAAAAPPGCIAADDPEALIQMNRLSSDLAHGCTVPVDVTGIAYDSLREVGATGQPVPRGDNTGFQAWLYHYLVSSSAFVLIHQDHDQSPPNIVAALSSHRPIIGVGGIILRQGDGY